MLKGMTRYAALLAAFAAQCFGAARADVRELVSAGKIAWSGSATAIYLNGSTVVGTNTIDSAAAYDNLVLLYTDSSEEADNWLSVDESIKAGARILAVGGGGAGGSGFGTGNNRGVGGGGGAGGMIETNDVRLAGGDYEIVVGAGGEASVASSAPAAGGNGGSSLFKSGTEIILEAFGGGGGGAECSGSAGGSGGGGSLDVSGTAHNGGNGSSGQGQNGGNGTSANTAGGGGGAQEAGSAGTTKNIGGKGGNGLVSDIVGAEVCYAGGGGGGTKQASNEENLGVGGLGGGGRGAGKNFNPIAGTDGLGGGGGGGTLTVAGANGGSGVVIVRITQAVETQVKVPEIDDLPYNGENQFALNFGIAYTYVSGVTNATTVGTYTFYVKPGPELEWLGGGTEERPVEWKIVKRLIEKPTIVQDLVFMSGTSQAGATFSEDCAKYCTLAEGSVTNAVNAGSYSFTLSLNDKANTEWDDYTTDDFFGFWSIAPVKVTQPVPVEGLVYDNTEKLGFASLELERYALTAGVTNATEGGSHSFTFSLLGNDSATNYVWDADPATAEPYSGTWSIAPASNEITEFSLRGWKIGTTPNDYEIEATWGADTVKVSYGLGSSESEVSTWIDNPNDLNESGTWIARAVIDATDSWAGATKSVTFSLWDNLGDFYSDKVDITIAARSGATQTLTNFPVLVRISEDRMKGFLYSRADAGGLCFTDSEGNPYAYEVDTWNTSGESLVWVCVPRLPPAGTTLTMNWNLKAGKKVPANNPADVWDDGYVGVWHLGESKLPMKDSSETSSDFTRASGTGIGYAAEGIAGGAVDFGKTGKSRYLLAPDHDELDGFEKMTIEAWTYIVQTNRPTGGDLNTGILGKRKDNKTEIAYYLFDSSNASAEQLMSSTHFYIATNAAKTAVAWSAGVNEYAGQWTYLAYTFDGTLTSNQVGSWTNGVRVQWNTLKINRMTASTADLCLGSLNAGDSRNFPGLIDEVRISKVARTKDWLKATYETIYTDSFSAPSSDVYIDGLKHDYWVVAPSVDKTIWDVSEAPAVFGPAPVAHSGANVTTNIYSVYDTTKTFESLSELTEPGYYRAEFFTEVVEGTEPLSCIIELHVIKSQPYSDIGGGDLGRTLLMNNHSGESGVPDVDYQGWFDADNAGANSSSTPTYWHHINLDAPAVTSYNLMNGTESMLFRAGGSRLWHLVSCRHGNTFPTKSTEGLTTTQVYLPYSASYSKRIDEHKTRKVTRSTVGQVVMQNTEDAAVYSSCFTNGIGTVYFDAVNGWCRSSEDFENYKLVVEIATNTVEGLLPYDINCYTWTVTTNEETAVESVTTNWYANLEGQWHEVQMLPFVRDNTEGFVKLDPTNELALAINHGGTTGNFYRVAAKVDIAGPVRFRIRRATYDASWPADNSSFILLDNIIASLPAMRGDLVSAGHYDEAKEHAQVLGWELATSVPYPSKNDDAVIPSAKPEYYVNAGGGTAVDTSTFFSDAKIHYRWRYLNQVTNEWKQIDLSTYDFKAISPMELPGRACDVEYWFEYTLQAPFYQYVDYSGVNKAIDYSEERGTLTNALNSATLMASAGTNWYFRVREGRSEYSGVDLVYVREGSDEEQRVAMSLVRDHMWYGFVQTKENQTGELKYRFEAHDRQTEPYAEYESKTNFWYCKTEKPRFPVSDSVDEGTAGDWSTITLDAVTGHVMFQVDDTTKSLTVVHADYQDFNGWSDACNRTDTRGRVIFVGTSTTNQYKVGVSPSKQTFAEDFSDWNTMPATNEYWRVPTFADINHLYGRTAYKTFSSDEDGLWSIGQGMWVAKKYADYRNGKGVAIQMEGQGRGYLQFTDLNAAPRGLETIEFNARLGQFVQFDDFAVYEGDLSLNLSNYTFMARAAFDLKSNTTFAGNGSLSLVGHYMRTKGAYEARWEWLGTGSSAKKGQRLCLYKWTVLPSGRKQCDLIIARTNENFDVATPTTLDVGSRFAPLFISVSNDVASSSTYVVAGIRHEAIELGASRPFPEKNWLGVCYRDSTATRLTRGTYGVLSANCPAYFAHPEVSPTTQVPPNDAMPTAASPKKSFGAQKLAAASALKNIKNCAEDDLKDSENLKWYIPVGRLATTYANSTVNAIYSAPVAQDLQVFIGTAGRADWGSTPVTNIALNSFGTSSGAAQFKVPLYTTKPCSVRLAAAGTIDDIRTDVVLDTVSLKQWRGGEWNDDNSVNGVSKYLPKWAEPAYRSNVNAFSNFVFTSCWVTNHTVLMSAKRADLDTPCAIRSPLMDGWIRDGRGGDGSVRGKGLGMISVEYANAQANVVLELQIATNDVSTTTIDGYDRLFGGSVWTTVTNFDFSAKTAAERKSGVLNCYIGLHDVAGAMRIMMSTNTIMAVAKETNKNKFGDITITRIVCRDEPIVDVHSWWGWNMRTEGGDEDKKGRMIIDDFSTAAGGAGLSLSLNNSVDETYDVSEIDVSDRQSYLPHKPFVQTPTFTSNVVGEISFRARKYSESDDTATLVLLGSTDASETDEGTWTKLAGGVFYVTNAYYETYSYKTDPGQEYKAFRLAVSGVPGVSALDGGGNALPDGVRQAERVLVDEMYVSEAVRARMGFRNVGCFKSDIAGTAEVANVPSRAEQPLCNEAWGVQCEVYGAQLADDIDFNRKPRVMLHWYTGVLPWGYDNWKDEAGHHSAWLSPATGVEEGRYVYRTSQRTSPDAVIPMSTFAPTYVQYMLEVVYYTKGSTIPTTNFLAKAEWGEDGRGPEWYSPLDLNAEYGRGKAFAAYNILDNVAPGWAWINEVNIFGTLVDGVANSDGDMQYIEIAQPPESDISDWTVRLLVAQQSSDLVLTNTLAKFGDNGLEGTKDARWIDAEANMVFRVIANKQSRDSGRLKYADGTLDGIWRLENDDIYTVMYGDSSGNTTISATYPFGLQLVRKSGIVEHEIVVMGTNWWSDLPSSYVSSYLPSNVVAFLNKKLPGAAFMYPGSDDDAGDPKSLGVWQNSGMSSNDWNNVMDKTPGRRNQNQTIDPDHPVPSGESVLVYLTVSGDHIMQWNGDEYTNTLMMTSVTKGSQRGTNVTYRLDPWYVVGEVTTNGVSAMGGLTRTKDTMPYEFTLEGIGKGASNNVTVVAYAAPDPRLEAEWDVGEDNPYRPAIIDWLNGGKDLWGNPFADPESGEIRLAEFRTLNNTFVTNMTLTEMYWLDMDPTIGNLALIGGMKESPTPHAMTAWDGTELSNVRMGVYLMITNENEEIVVPEFRRGRNDFGTHWTPYALRGLESGSSSLGYSSATDEWNSVSFKITGLLMNGLVSGKDNRMPVRWFVFKEDSFEPDGISRIEIEDPYWPESVGYNTGWGKWWEKEKAAGKSPLTGIGWFWAIDTRLQPASGIEVLKPRNYYGED